MADTGAGYAATLASTVFTSDDPKASYLALPASDRAVFDRYTNAASVTIATTYTELNGQPLLTPAAYSGCYQKSAKGWVKNLVGVNLVEFGQATKVCVSSGKVKSVSILDVYYNILAIGWSQSSSPTKTTKNVGWEGRGLVQWHFALGAGGWVIQNETPCLQQRLNANGTSYAGSMSCSIS